MEAILLDGTALEGGERWAEALPVMLRGSNYRVSGLVQL